MCLVEFETEHVREKKKSQRLNGVENKDEISLTFYSTVPKSGKNKERFFRYERTVVEIKDYILVLMILNSLYKASINLM